MSSIDFDVVVVGAGLCGLSIAHLLKKQNLRVLVLESRSEPGGRIRSVRDSHTREALGDLGPTWVWPACQPLLQRWLESLGVSTVAQFSGNNSLIETSPETAPHLDPVPMQLGAFMIDAGASSLVDALRTSLSDPKMSDTKMGDTKMSDTKMSDTNISVNEHVSGVDASGAQVLVHSNSRAAPVSARQVVLAMPPRIIHRSIRFSPPLTDEATEALKRAPTWMASHAKIVLLYAHAFWREQSHGGRLFSKIGPIGELQDHSGPVGYPAALTGFIAWPAGLRRDADAEIEKAIHAQLGRVFGVDAPTPLHIVIKDWAQDQLVATQQDLDDTPGHRPLLPAFLRDSHLQGRVWLAGAELAPVSPGLIEGAFASAEHTVKRILESLEARSTA